MIELEFVGAAQTVTGSKHWLRTSRASLLLDCGLYQGHRKASAELNRNFAAGGIMPAAVVLSHAHIDHSGALPCLYKNGFRGPVYATPATRDLVAPMLLDTAWIMKSDAEHIRKLIEKGVRHLDLVEALYGEEEVKGILSQFVGVHYHQRQKIADGVHLTFLDAGHVLGSAITVLEIEDEGKKVRLAFTGDLGRKHLPIVRDPEVARGADYLMMESTYGDRLHDSIEDMNAALAEVIRRTVARGGKVVIPSFALERAQEIIYALKDLRARHQIPDVPVYVDSPLTVKLTDVFKAHPECFDAGVLRQLEGDDSPFEFPDLHYISSLEESKRLSTSHEPAVVISASGMCEGGRVLHHLLATIEDARNTVLIVGFQAENTLGRRLVERREEVRIFGQLHPLKAEVCVLNGFSAHADQADLMEYAQATRAQGALQKLILVHGEPNAQNELAGKLKATGFVDIEIPRPGQKIILG